MGTQKNKTMNKLLIATTNKGKIKEFQELLRELDVELLTPSDINLALDITEDGHTYAENASKKAVAFAKASGLISLADDSGLEVDALNGAPGLYSARYSPKPDADDENRRNYLIQNLSGKPQPWSAHFHAAIAIARPSGDLRFTEGTCYGEIISTERGTGGFGYDPIFFIPALGKTMAELEMEQKNQISHRALAINNSFPILHSLFNSP